VPFGASGVGAAGVSSEAGEVWRACCRVGGVAVGAAVAAVAAGDIGGGGIAVAVAVVAVEKRRVAAKSVVVDRSVVVAVAAAAAAVNTVGSDPTRSSPPLGWPRPEPLAASSCATERKEPGRG